MSLDLGVWCATKQLDSREGGEVYARLCSRKGGPVAADLPLESSVRVEAFYRALVARYPELDASDDDDDDDGSPFACAIDLTAHSVVLSISFSRATEVAAFVEALAREHRLDTYDPQESAILSAFDPTATPRSPPGPKLKPKEGLARLVTGLTPKMAELGFVQVRRKQRHPPMWQRARSDDVVHRVVAEQIGSSYVVASVAIGLSSAERFAARLERDTYSPLPEEQLSRLYYQGWIPGEAWEAADDRTRFQHTFCHEECLARSVDSFVAAVVRYALPFFAMVETPAALDALLDRRVPFEAPRPNYKGIAFTYPNPTALLHRLTIAKVVRGNDAVAAIFAAEVANWKQPRNQYHLLYTGEFAAQLKAHVATLVASDVDSLRASTAVGTANAQPGKRRSASPKTPKVAKTAAPTKRKVATETKAKAKAAPTKAPRRPRTKR